ncbi:MAG: AAA family ATPase, partial [Clostridia bacterium]|nr:AAA family ATPase [Clostridia bacterium]
MVQDERNIGLGAAAERSPSASTIRTLAGDQASPIGWLQPVEPRREDDVYLSEGHDGIASLEVTDAETLADLRLPPARFCVDSLLPQGLTILGGAPKVGKSWLTLDLCLRVAKGEPLWGLATSKGTTLCLCLEDTLSRVQQRLLCITDDAPGNAFFATAADLLADGLCDQIRRFVAEHSDTVLVVIDTFQLVRGGAELSYATDYEQARQLKQLADALSLSLLLVHHLRKRDDADPLNRLSGTTG